MENTGKQRAAKRANTSRGKSAGTDTGHARSDGANAGRSAAWKKRTGSEAASVTVSQIRAFVLNVLSSFESDPADTQFQRGFQAAFELILEEALMSERKAVRQ